MNNKEVKFQVRNIAQSNSQVKWLRMRQEPYCQLKKGTAKSKKRLKKYFLW